MDRKFDGVEKDPEDKRDYHATDLLRQILPLEPKYCAVGSFNNFIIYDQKSSSKCVAYGACGIKSDEEFKQSRSKLIFDPEWLFAECKKLDGIPDKPGTYPRVACEVLAKGAKTAGDEQPDAKWKIAEYYRIYPETGIDEIKQILVQYGSFMVACAWYQSWSAAKDIMPEPRGRQGGHNFDIVGYDDTLTVPGFYVRNSWGYRWGNTRKCLSFPPGRRTGISLMPYDMFMTWVLKSGESDCWQLVDAV